MTLTRRSALRLLAATVAVPSLDSTRPLFSQTHPESAVPQVGERGTYKDPHAPIEQRVSDLLRRMTVEEKARQLDLYAGMSDKVQSLARHDETFLKENFSRIAPREPNGPPMVNAAAPADKSKPVEFHPDVAGKVWGNLGVGSIHGLNPTPDLSNKIQEWMMQNTRLGIPVLFLAEGLHEYYEGTVFPSSISLGATWNPTLARQTGAAIAAEARANGIAMILAPVLDVARDPRWGRVEEGFGEDPYLSGQLGLAFVQGAQGESLNSDHTVVAEVKHFAGYGSPESGTNTSPVHIGERELRTVMLKSLEPAIREGNAMALMAAYPEIDGIPVTADRHLLTGILRDEWGFKGFVLSDLGAIRHLYDRHFVAATPKDAVCRAINAGVDMQFYDFEHSIFQGAIITGLQDGTLLPAALDRAVSAVLRVKFSLGLFDRPMVDTTLDAKVRRRRSHLDLSLESARQSMTLLKNDGELLPLSKALKTIAAIGPNAAAAQYGDYADEKKGAQVSLLDGIKTLLPSAQVIFDDGSNIPAAMEMVKDAEVLILALGEHQGLSGEGFDRSDLSLPDNQGQLLEAMIATNKPVVLVLQNGRPLTIHDAITHVPAVIEAWYPGEFGGTAIAETLFGDNNPAGRLPMTFPRNVGQVPDFYNYDPSKKVQYVDFNGAPAFPFGYGLSYTTFKYDELTVKPPVHGSGGDVVINVRVTNTGAVAGDEVAQLYFREDVTSVETPIRALVAFSRFALKAGETQTVTFRLKQSQLAVWNENARWEIEPGGFTVWVGGSSEAELKKEFTIR